MTWRAARWNGWGPSRGGRRRLPGKPGLSEGASNQRAWREPESRKAKEVFIILVLAGLLAAWPPAATPAGSGPQILEEKDRGRTIDLQVGQKLILNLRNPGSGGYNTNPALL